MCAAEAIIDMPYLVLYPILNVLFVMLFFFAWCAVVLFLASAGEDDFDKVRNRSVFAQYPLTIRSVSAHYSLSIRSLFAQYPLSLWF